MVGALPGAGGDLNDNRGRVKGDRGSERKRFRLSAGIGIFFILISAPVSAEENHWKALGVIRLPGHVSADFTLPSLDGKPITLSDLRGKVVLINFWTTWCSPCREEMKSMERLYRKLKHRQFTILAVDIMENPETVRDFAQRHELSFPIVLDAKGEVSGKYMATAIPMTYILDKHLRAVGKVIGPRRWVGGHAEAILGELLGD
jgi:peroxiredoxin